MSEAYKIRFVAIEIMSKSIVEPPKEIVEIQAGNNAPSPITFNFNFLVDIKLGAPQKVAVVITNVTIFEAKENTELARFKTACIFELPDFDVIFKKLAENLYDTPEDLEIILKGSGISTTRGIIFSELRGSYLQGAVLPLVDMATLVKDQKRKAKEQAEK
jgi:hypothetical protein